MREATLTPQDAIPARTPALASSETAVEGLLHHLSDRIQIPAPIDTLRTRFAEAKPFRHIVMDDLFSPTMLTRVLDEVPPLTKGNFITHHDDHQTKFGLRSAIALKDEGYQFASFLHSAAFLYLVSEITGIWGLLPDPYMQGGGYHVIPPGGKFDVHLDRKTDYATGLRRRLAMITYLNKDWKPEYGGQLELWNPEGTQCEASVVPLFNRTIIFEVADGNYHGHPHPVAAPDGPFAEVLCRVLPHRWRRQSRHRYALIDLRACLHLDPKAEAPRCCNRPRTAGTPAWSAQSEDEAPLIFLL